MRSTFVPYGTRTKFALGCFEFKRLLCENVRLWLRLADKFALSRRNTTRLRDEQIRFAAARQAVRKK